MFGFSPRQGTTFSEVQKRIESLWGKKAISRPNRGAKYLDILITPILSTNQPVNFFAKMKVVSGFAFLY